MQGEGNVRVGQKGSEGAGLKDWSYAATSQVMPEPSEAGRSKEWIVTHWKLTHLQNETRTNCGQGGGRHVQLSEAVLAEVPGLQVQGEL